MSQMKCACKSFLAGFSGFLGWGGLLCYLLCGSLLDDFFSLLSLLSDLLGLGSLGLSFCGLDLGSLCGLDSLSGSLGLGCFSGFSR